MGKALVAVIVLIVILLVFSLVFFGQYVSVKNTLVTKNEAVKSAWSQVDIVLQRRADLIPNLVETVKGYMLHEQQTLLAVAQARTASISAASIKQKAQADLMMTGALRGFFAIAENYPQLKANQNFLKLQTRISELEERIADRREFFNDDVNTYNTRIGQIPEVFVASFMKLKPRSMFQVSEEDRKLVEVKFQSQGAAGA